MSNEEPSNPSGDAATRSVVVWAGLALVVALAAAGWWAARTQRLPRALPAPDVEDELTEGPTESPGDSASSASTAGLVLVRVVDVNDGSALEGVEVDLVAEEPVRRRFGRARSDLRGEVRFERVFAPLLLAQVRRSERFAVASTIVRGDVASGRAAVLRLGSGGTISGRVVDDSGAPVDGAPLILQDISGWPDPVQAAPIVTRTGPDGSYRIERVVDMPRTITARDGELFAAAWSAVIVEARGIAGGGRSAQSVRPCTDAIAPDIVLSRPPTLSGRVLDFDRRPVAGALVSVNPERQKLSQANLHVVDPAAVGQGVADLPGTERFALRQGEALTANDGSFTLSGASQRSSALVVLADGRLEDFSHGQWSPGGRVDGLEFVLAERQVLRMRLFDPEGRKVLGAVPTSEDTPTPAEDVAYVRVAPVGGMLMNAWTSSRVDLFAELSDGRELRVQCAPSADGTLTFALASALPSIERLSITAPGYKTRVRECHGRLRPESVIANEHLEPLDTLELVFQLSGMLEDPPGSEPQGVQVRACELAPETVSDPAHPRPACCGFGMFAQFNMLDRERRISIPMLSERPFWLTVRTSRGRYGEEFVVGPFRTDEGMQSIDIPALAPGPSPFDRPVPTAGRTDPRAISATKTASLCAFDAVSGAALSGAAVWVLCDPLGREAWLGRTWTTDADGCAALDGLFDGAWTLVVSAAGHQAQRIGPLEIGAASSATDEIDLGEVRLSPVD